jgi:hypothetical protein
MNRFIVPLFFAAAVIAVMFGYLWLVLRLPLPGWIKLIAGLIIASLIAAMAYVVILRKRELDKEDLDDLSKY